MGDELDQHGLFLLSSCYICGPTTSPLQKIDNNNTARIEFLYSLQVKDDNTFPSTICNVCIARANKIKNQTKLFKQTYKERLLKEGKLEVFPYQVHKDSNCNLCTISKKISNIAEGLEGEHGQTEGVNTRGIKVKFSEGERVLCYEPDPTKAKVLYDSKVLQVVYNKDSKGRIKSVEYLIHFQGWNASWDRCVNEDFILRDSEENRQLQKSLADKAQIKLSIKSNRVLIGHGSMFRDKKRKRRLSETIRETIERERKKKEQTESETSSQTGTTTASEDDDATTASEVESTMETEEGADEDEEEVPDQVEEDSDDETIERHFPITIPDNLKEVLERDHHFINDENKLLDLPSDHPALQVLEDYIKFFIMRYLARTKEKRRSEIKDKDKCYLTLDLCKEVVDGIRIIFDFHIETLLLYAKERTQSERLRSAEPILSKKNGIDDLNDSCIQSIEDKENKEVNKDEMVDPNESRTRSEKKLKVEESIQTELTPQRQLRSKRILSGDSIGSVDRDRHLNAMNCESGRSSPTTGTSCTSTAGISGLDTGAGMKAAPLLLNSFQQPHTATWKLLPDSYYNPPPPSLIYGPLHLLRVFVKLPEILYRQNLPENKKKIIMKHVELFLEYLSNHCSELFTDSKYIPNPDITDP